jgi:hypothetical protein
MPRTSAENDYLWARLRQRIRRATSEQILQTALSLFCDRGYYATSIEEIDRIITSMHRDVKWANGMGCGFIYVRKRVREYWQKQFETISPQLKPVKFETDDLDRYFVTIKQIV